MKFSGSAADNLGQLLLARGPSTAAELADTMGLTGAAIRKSLDSLMESGCVEATERAPFGPAALEGPRGRGRPARVFTLTPVGRSKFGAHEETLAVAAMKFLSQTAGEQAVAQFAQQIAADFAHRHPEVTQAKSASERAQALAKALDEDGFAATATPGLGDSTQICQQHCPMGDVATAFPIMCQEETEMFSLLTGVHVTRLATIATGSPVCTTLVPNNRRDHS